MKIDTNKINIELYKKYAPVMLSGFGLYYMIMNDYISMKRMAAINTSYNMVSKSFKRYRRKVKWKLFWHHMRHPLHYLKYKYITKKIAREES